MSSPYGINQTKRTKLRDMKVFVLDNSLRESTIAQPAGHTLKDKYTYRILEEIKKCGFQDVLVAAFGGHRRVDDAFCENLKEAFSGENAPKRTYAFTEVTDKVTNGEMTFGDDFIPTGLQRMKKYGINNAVIEIDLNTTNVDWDGKFPVAKAIKVIEFLAKWSQNNLPSSVDGAGRRNFVNLRDVPLAMTACSKRVFDLVAGIARLPLETRPCGIMFEEPLGEYFPDEVANFTSAIRKTMDDNGWKSKWQTPENEADGLLLYHVHEQYGFANATVMDALAAGADGMWCGLSEEGASMGHASSAVAWTNLARLGNKDVLQRFNTRHIVSAAREVAEITTGKSVRSTQIVYGSGAVDICFGFGAIAQGKRSDNTDYNGDGMINDLDKFSVAGMMNLADAPARISTLASPGLVVKQLKKFFGEDEECLPMKMGDSFFLRLKRILKPTSRRITMNHITLRSYGKRHSQMLKEYHWESQKF